MNARHAFDMLMQDLKAQVEQATQERGDKAKTKAKKLEAKATAEGNLKDTKDTKEADEKYLKDLEATQKELDAALAYFDKLKPSCVDAGVSYEDRVARRKEEIESLQEALRILNGEDLA